MAMPPTGWQQSGALESSFAAETEPLLGRTPTMAAPQDEEAKKLPYGTDFSASDSGSIEAEEVYAYDDSRKLGITSSVFLILNKMIGTGSVSSFPKHTLYELDTYHGF